MNVRLIHSFRFEAAHHLPRLPADHKCRRLHGHGYRIEIEVSGPIDPVTGWYMDFAEIRRMTDPVRQQLDHQVLNDIEGLENPTAELLCVWIWRELKPALSGLRRVTVLETCTCRCDYLGPEDSV
jgi:6-pyruvoyltetrahydropterin/6-carboxytetrahydropterin synthase